MISDTSPLHMARDLVARHSDIGFVRGYIINWFGRDVPLPTREQIEKLRAEHLAHQSAVHERRKGEENGNVRRERNRARYHARRARKAA